MEIKKIIKRLTLYSSLIAFLFLLNSSSLKKNKEYLRDNFRISKNKIEYSLGNIYIGNKKYLEEINDLKENDILVLDKRISSDPNLKIYNSYLIRNDDIIEEIIESLLYYEELYPTNWERTKSSLIREWSAHNMMHDLGYELDRTTDVDLNNADEIVYRIRQ